MLGVSGNNVQTIDTYVGLGEVNEKDWALATWNGQGFSNWKWSPWYDRGLGDG